MSELFPWETRYVLGIKDIDDQHRRLVGMINSLHTGMKEGRGREATDDILRSLMDYALYHFKAEEDLMSRYNFPDLPKHREEHLAFMDRVGELSARHGAGEFLVSLELNDFLKAWLSDHILSTDMRYAPFVRARMR